MTKQHVLFSFSVDVEQTENGEILIENPVWAGIEIKTAKVILEKIILENEIGERIELFNQEQKRKEKEQEEKGDING